MHKRWFLIFWTICSLLMRVHGQVEGIEGLEGLDDEEDDDYDDSTSERQFGGAMRDAVKNFVTGTVKYITNTRLIPSVVSQALRRPFPALASLSSSQSSPTSSSSSSASSAINSAASQSINSLGMGSGSTDNGPLSALSAGQSMAQSAPVSSLSSNGMSTASSSPMAALSSLTGNINALLPFAGSNQIQQASELLGNVFRNMRSNWARRNQEQQQQIRKRLQSITKRLTSSRVLSSTLHRLTGRHDRSDLKTSESISKPVFSAQNLPQFIPVPYLMPTY